MKQYVIAAIAGISLASLAAVGAFASEPLTALVGEETETPTETVTGTLEATETPSDTTPTPGSTETPSDATATPEATGTPDTTPTPEATGTSEPEPTSTPEDGEAADGDDGPRDIKGIPTHNPNHTDDDGDGICEKGETKIKTTPSGNQVRVPCHAGKDDDEEEEKNSGATEDGDKKEKEDKKPKH